MEYSTFSWLWGREIHFEKDTKILILTERADEFYCSQIKDILDGVREELMEITESLELNENESTSSQNLCETVSNSQRDVYPLNCVHIKTRWI